MCWVLVAACKLFSCAMQGLVPWPGMESVLGARSLTCWTNREVPSMSLNCPYLSIHPCLCSVMSDSATLWTVAHQAPLSMGFSRQKYWSGLPCPPPGDLPNTGIKPTSPVSPALQVDSLPTEPLGKPLLQHCFCFMFWLFDYEACEILGPWPGIEPTPPVLEDKVLTTGLPGKSLSVFLKGILIVVKYTKHLPS